MLGCVDLSLVFTIVRFSYVCICACVWFLFVQVDSEEQIGGGRSTRVKVKFDVVGPRASGRCKAYALLRGGAQSVEDVSFLSLQLRVGNEKIDVRGVSGTGAAAGVKVVDAEGYKEK